MHPVLVDFGGGMMIGTYGVLIAVGLLTAVLLAAWRGKSRGFSPENFMDLAVIAGVAGFAGARVLYILLDFRGFLADPAPYIFSRTGFVFLGGLIAAAAACSWYIRRQKMEFWMTADILVISLAVGHAFGRIGCHLAGCCFGGVCTGPLGIQVPAVLLNDGTVWPNAFVDQMEAGLLAPDALVSLPIWPVQLFEAAGLFALAAIMWVIGARPHRRGLILGIYLTGYAAMRFGLEFLRGDAVRGLFFGGLLSTSQIISILMFLIGVGVLATGRFRTPWEPLPAKEEKKRPPIRKGSAPSTPTE